MFYKFLAIFCGAVLYSVSADAAQLFATVEPQQVQFGDTVNLEIVYEGNDSGSVQPDFSAVQANFAVYSTSTSMQSSYVNGVGQQRRSWKLLLMPKKEGDLQIPAIKVGNDVTSPLNVKVYAAGQANLPPTPSNSNQAASGIEQRPTNGTSSDNNFWAELSVSNKKPYIQQAINATLYIYDRKGIEFQQEPIFDDTDNWIIRRAGDPVVSNGQGQRVIAFNYVLIPQKSGKIAIPRVQINGTYTDSTQTPVTNSIDGLFKMFELNFELNSLFATPKPVLMETKPIDVNVLPVPEDYGNSWWLPATALRLEAKWVDSSPVFKVGEVVTREIYLAAADVDESQIPELKLKSNSIWRQYSEKPKVSSEFNNNRLITRSVTRVVYIPQQGGEQEIPEIKLRWYNVQTNHIETTIIPAQKVFVTGDAEVVAQPQESQKQQAKPQSENSKAEEKPSTIDKTAQTFNRIMGWVWLILAFLAGIFVCLLLVTRKKQTEPKPKATDYMKQIENSLENKDYRGLRDALLNWGEQHFPNENIKNLDDLSLFVDSAEFSEQMRLLSDNLYASGQAELSASAICESLKKKRAKAKKKVKQPLPDLYK